MREKEAQLTKDLKFWQENFNEVERQVRSRKMHIHPMAYEDLWANLQATSEKHQASLQAREESERRVRRLELEKVTAERSSKIQNMREK